MSTRLNTPSDQEAEMIKILREAFDHVVEKNHWGDDAVAERLGVAPVGATMFRRRTDWSLEEAVRAAGAVGVRCSLALAHDDAVRKIA